ncbi:MAG: VanZ family protein [Saccharofermentans sp.]|nr:VanZ family protein [Saccharofermentans sp.]
MRIVTFLELELIFAVVWILFRVVAALVTRKFDIKRELLLLLIYFNLAVIIRFVYFPLEELTDLVISVHFYQKPAINLVPFVNILDYRAASSAVTNVLGNLLLFVPLGILVPVSFKKFDSFPKTVLAGFLISLAIELTQLVTPGRVTDVDDLIVNTLGAAVGYFIYALVKKAFCGKSAA